MQPVASVLLVLNFCMYVVIAALGGWSLNVAVDRGFIVGPALALPAHFTPVFFPIGNRATGFFVIFSLVAATVGAAAALSGIYHVRKWSRQSLPSAATSAFYAWGLTLLAMGLGVKEIVLDGRNAKLVRSRVSVT